MDRLQLNAIALDPAQPELARIHALWGLGQLGAPALRAAGWQDFAAFSGEPLAQAVKLAMVGNTGASEQNRVSALQALVGRPSAQASGILQQAVAQGLAANAVALRIAALAGLAAYDQDQATIKAELVAVDGKELRERQAAILLLGHLGTPAAERWLAAAVDALMAGRHGTGTGLEILEAAAQVGGESLQQKLAAYQRGLPADPVAARKLTLQGGDAAHGKSVFDSGGDCLRCHAVNGKGGNAGPDLAGIASRHDALYLLEAMATPGSAIAPGYGSVVLNMQDDTTVAGILVGEDDASLQVRAYSAHGEGGASTIDKADIASVEGPISGMPPMGLVLSQRDLRDVMAYLKSLR